MVCHRCIHCIKQNITFHLEKGEKSLEVLFFPVEERSSCGISLFGPECTHMRQHCSVHFQPVDYFGNEVSGRPVSGCCCIDAFRLKCFQRDKPGGRKKPDQ